MNWYKGGYSLLITKELAQPIVDKMMAVIDHNINIMNQEGIIIGSGDSSRLYTEHVGGLEAITLKQEKVIYASDENEPSKIKPGVNLPIEFNNEIIGAVGITGNPEIVYKLSQLVRISVEALIKQQYLNDKLLYKRKSIESWIYDLVNKDLKEKEFEERALQININVNKEAYLLLLRVEELVRPKKQSMEIHEKFQLEETRFLQIIDYHLSDIIFKANVGDSDYLLAIQANSNSPTQINELLNKLHNALTTKDWTVKIGGSNLQSGVVGFKRGFLEAQQSLKLMCALEPERSASTISDWGVVQYINKIPIQVRKEFQDSIRSDKKSIDAELLRTLDVFLENDLKIGETANKLFIHRNTLLYRLEKIEKLWNLDPRKFNDAFILQLLNLCIKLEKKE